MSVIKLIPKKKGESLDSESVNIILEKIKNDVMFLFVVTNEDDSVTFFHNRLNCRELGFYIGIMQNTLNVELDNQ